MPALVWCPSEGNIRGFIGSCLNFTHQSSGGCHVEGTARMENFEIVQNSQLEYPNEKYVTCMLTTNFVFLSSSSRSFTSFELYKWLKVLYLNSGKWNTKISFWYSCACYGFLLTICPNCEPTVFPKEMVTTNKNTHLRM